MTEAELTTQVKNDLIEYCKARAVPVYWHKLDDFPANSIAVYLRNHLCPRCQPVVNQTGLGRFQSRKRPFDVFCIIDGIPVGIEFKVHNEESAAFPLLKVKDYQEAGLLNISAAGGVGLVAIGNVFEPKYPPVRPPDGMYRGTMYRLLVLPYATWRGLRMQIGETRKSVPMDELVKSSLVVIRRNLPDIGRVWDPKELLSVVRGCQGWKPKIQEAAHA